MKRTRTITRTRTRIGNRLRGNKWLVVLVGMLLMIWMLAGCSASNSDDSGSDQDSGGAALRSQAASPAASTESSQSTNDAKSSMADGGATADKAANVAVTQSSSGSVAGASIGGNAEGAGEGDFDRKIVYKGNVTMEVEAYDTAQTALRDLIHLSGGYLLKFSDQKTSTEKGGTFTIKVPATGFDGFLSGLEKIKHLSYQSSAQGTDVTEEYVDLQARLKARQVVEARLLDFMAKATKTADLLQISKQLGDVQTEIEQIKGRMRYLDSNVSFSTIDLRMYEVTKAGESTGDVKTGFGERISDALKDSTKVMYAFLQGLIVFIAGALPVLAVLVVIGIPTYAVYRKGKRKQSAANIRVKTGPAAEASEATPLAEDRKAAGTEETKEDDQ